MELQNDEPDPNEQTELLPDPASEVIGNGIVSHYDLAKQLENRGYIVDPDPEDNHHSWVYHPMTGEIIVADIRGDDIATVTNC